MFFPSKPLSIGGFPLPRWITEGSKLTLNDPVRKLAGHIISSNILGMNYNTSFTNRKENNTGMATPCQPLFQYRRSEVVAVHRQQCSLEPYPIHAGYTPIAAG